MTAVVTAAAKTEPEVRCAEGQRWRGGREWAVAGRRGIGIARRLAADREAVRRETIGTSGIAGCPSPSFGG